MVQMPEAGLTWLAKADSAEIIIFQTSAGRSLVRCVEFEPCAELKKAPQSNGEPDVYSRVRAAALVWRLAIAYSIGGWLSWAIARHKPH